MQFTKRQQLAQAEGLATPFIAAHKAINPIVLPTIHPPLSSRLSGKAKAIAKAKAKTETENQLDSIVDGGHFQGISACVCDFCVRVCVTTVCVFVKPLSTIALSKWTNRKRKLAAI